MLPRLAYYPRAARVYAHIVANIDKPLCGRDLAAVAGMEVTAFCRFLRCKVGVTPKELVAYGKVAFAATLMQHSDYSVGEMATRVGLSANSLRRAVKRVTGSDLAHFRSQYAQTIVRDKRVLGEIA